MADQIAAIVFITLPLSNLLNLASTSKNTQKSAQNSLTNFDTTNKINIYLILDLAQCLVNLHERSVKAIQDYLQSSIKLSN